MGFSESFDRAWNIGQQTEASRTLADLQRRRYENYIQPAEQMALEELRRKDAIQAEQDALFQNPAIRQQLGLPSLGGATAPAAPPVVGMPAPQPIRPAPTVGIPPARLPQPVTTAPQAPLEPLPQAAASPQPRAEQGVPDVAGKPIPNPFAQRQALAQLKLQHAAAARDMAALAEAQKEVIAAGFEAARYEGEQRAAAMTNQQLNAWLAEVTNDKSHPVNIKFDPAVQKYKLWLDGQEKTAVTLSKPELIQLAGLQHAGANGYGQIANDRLVEFFAKLRGEKHKTTIEKSNAAATATSAEAAMMNARTNAENSRLAAESVKLGRMGAPITLEDEQGNPVYAVPVMGPDGQVRFERFAMNGLRPPVNPKAVEGLAERLYAQKFTVTPDGARVPITTYEEAYALARQQLQGGASRNPVGGPAVPPPPPKTAQKKGGLPPPTNSTPLTPAETQELHRQLFGNSPYGAP